MATCLSYKLSDDKLDPFAGNNIFPIDYKSFLLTTEKTQDKHIFNHYFDENSVKANVKTIGSIFLATASARKDVPAIIQINDNNIEPNILTYSQLYNKVRILAHQLIFKYDIKVGDVICQCMERSFDMIIGFLAILLAGAVYCPLNPTDPKDRLTFLIETTQARLILLHNSTEHIFQHVNSQIKKFRFNHNDLKDSMDQSKLISSRSQPSDLAYIIFTSGSTGNPKGVPISHSNFLSHWRGLHQPVYNDKPLLSSDDVVLAVCSPTFDVSLDELLSPLLLGSQIVILQPRDHLNTGHVVDIIESQKITQFSGVPSALRIFLDFVEGQQCSHRLGSLRSVWCGGEMVTSQLAFQFYKNMPFPSLVEFINVYGPTECSILTTYHRVTKADIDRDILPIGRPILNYSCLILDKYLNTVLQGTTGELFIGGPGVFNGYLIGGNKEDIDRMKKLNDRILVDLPTFQSQLNKNHHEKFYRTGDLCRLNDDGEIIFVSRMDTQVKLRGQRLELGEIEACISTIPFVTHCIVLKCVDKNTGHEFLAAYIQSHPSSSSSSSNTTSSSSSSSLSMKELIQQRCRAHLPAYMIPTVIVFMDHLPHNTNGKIDRKQLPIPEFDRQLNSRYCEYKEPTSELECAIHSHWSSILGIDRISIHDNFFSLSGNSLLLMNLFSKYRAAGLIKWNTISIDPFFIQATLIGHVDLLQQLNTTSSSTNHIVDQFERVQDDPWLPLGLDEAVTSAAQERIWLDEQLRFSKMEKAAIYNVITPFIVSNRNHSENSHIILDRLRRSLLAVIRRHKVLRTGIRQEKNIIKQYINPMPIDLPLEQHDRFYSFIDSACSTDDELKQALSNEVFGHFFRLDEGIVVRCHVIRRSTKDIGQNQLKNGDLVVFNVHHTAIDGESRGLLLNHIERAYNDEHTFGERGGEDLFQYIDFSIHESRFLRIHANSSQLAEARAYWKRTLDGCLDIHLSLGQSPPRMDKENGHGNYLFDLSMDLIADFVSLAATHNLSLHQMFLAAYILFLHKLTGEDDICVGGVTANRYRPEQHDLIGMFVNLLPYRVKIDESDNDLLTYYAKIRQLCFDFMRYSVLPLQEVIKLHRTSHDQLDRTPFFQTTLAFYSNAALSHVGTYSLDGVLCESIPLPVSVVKFDLSLVINHTLSTKNLDRKQQHKICCKWEYSTRLFQQNELPILAERFISFLTSLIDAEKITQMTVLIPNDFKVIRQLNDTSIDFLHSTAHSSIDANFDIHVRNNPQKIALIYDDTYLTYDQLDKQVNKLAAYLMESYSICRGEVIIQCMSRGIEMVIGILAILKTQAIYCPFNPADPSQRHLSLINYIKARIILCDRTTQPIFQAIIDSNENKHDHFILFNVTTEGNLSTTQTIQSLPQQSSTTANDLAYIVHTSGSTGKPKAVPISHGNFMACIHGMQHLKMIHSSDITVQITECSYDVHLMEILGCLVTGGTLVMLKQHCNMDMTYLANTIERYNVTWAILVPTIALALYEEVSSNVEHRYKLQSLMTCISGGEAMVPSTIRNLLPYFSTNVRVYNVYGPAEASMASTIHQIQSEDLSAKFVPIGRPLPNYSCHILDKNLCPTPVGSIGELFIGGSGVFGGYRGYANDNKSSVDIEMEKINASALVHIPIFQSQSSSNENYQKKFYRTGDLCRLNDDGEIMFVGRADHQVKIRGQRIELGEIEVCIMAAAPKINVRNCVVIKYIDQSTSREYLAAYVQAPQNTLPDDYNTIQMNLIKHCMQYLPAHMVPSSWFLLDSFPLNANDKVDRKELTCIPLPKIKNNYKSVLQRTKSHIYYENALSEIFSDCLNIEIGEDEYHKSFIELGGTSLSAMTIVKHIRKHLDETMEICFLLKNPTISELAMALRSSKKTIF